MLYPTIGSFDNNIGKALRFFYLLALWVFFRKSMENHLRLISTYTNSEKSCLLWVNWTENGETFVRSRRVLASLAQIKSSQTLEHTYWRGTESASPHHLFFSDIPQFFTIEVQISGHQVRSNSEHHHGTDIRVEDRACEHSFSLWNFQGTMRA